MLKVETGGVAIFLPEADRMWHIAASKSCESQANAAFLFGPGAGRRVPLYRQVGRQRVRRDGHGAKSARRRGRIGR